MPHRVNQKSGFSEKPGFFALLAKRWFLLLLAVGIALALLRTDDIRQLVGQVPSRLVVAATLFLMSWSLESRRLWQSLVRPMPALWAVVISYGLLPGLGWAASLPFGRDYQIGLLVITSVPCTIASAAIWTRLAGGNEATALLVTMLTTCTSWLVTTAWLTWTTGAQVSINVAEMMWDLVLILVLPVLAGQLTRWPGKLRQVAVSGKITISVISRLLIFIIVIQAVVKAAGELRRDSVSSQLVALLAATGVCLALHLIALAFGLWTGRIWKFDRANRIAVAFSGSQKTLPVALLLVEAHFKDYPLAVVPVLFYHVGQLLVDTFIADSLARQTTPQEERQLGVA